MRQYPSMERILGIPEPPQAVVNGDTERLIEKIYGHLEHFLHGGVRDAGRQRQLLQLLSDFQELQLCLECELDDRERWGEAWKKYAQASIPVEYHVQLQLEQAATTR